MTLLSLEDDWERDIHLDSASPSIFSSEVSNHGVLGVSVGVNHADLRSFHYSPDKDLAIACDHYRLNKQFQQQGPVCYYEDDCESSVAGSIFTSAASMFSEPSMLYSPILDDDFMFDEPLLPSKKYSHPADKRNQPAAATQDSINQQDSSYPGIVQQLGTPAKYQRPVDSNDWTDDISILPHEEHHARQNQSHNALNPGSDQQASLDILAFDFNRLSKKLYGIPKFFEKDYEEDDDDDGLGDFNEMDIGPSISQRNSFIDPNNEKRAPSTSAIANVVKRNKIDFEIEDDEDDYCMDGLEFPQDMGTLAFKLEEKKKYDPSKAQPETLPPPSRPQVATKSPRPTTTRIPIPAASKAKALAAASKESDDDDFFAGLDLALNDKAFDLNNNQQQQQQQPMVKPQRTQSNTPKGKSTFVSRLARPTTVPERSPFFNQPQPQQQKRSLQKLPVATPTSSSSASLLRNRNLLSNKQPAMQREAPVAHQKRSAIPNTSRRLVQQVAPSWQSSSRVTARPTITPPAKNNVNTARPSRQVTIQPNRKQQQFQQQQQAVMRKSPTSRHTLIAQPKGKPGLSTYRAEIDDLDNLPTMVPKNNIKTAWKTMTPAKKQQQQQTDNQLNTADPKRPWRTNMQTSTKGKVKLLQPSQQDLKKEYNNMKYDEHTQTWKGNEDFSFFDSLATSEIGGSSSVSKKQQKKPISGLRLIGKPRIGNNRRAGSDGGDSTQGASAAASSTPLDKKPTTASRYTAIMSHNMIFDDQKQKWVSALGEDNECNELDAIGDLCDGYVHNGMLMTGIRNGRNPEIHGNDRWVEFRLTEEQRFEMLRQEEEHKEFMKNWPLMKEESDKVMTPSRNLVPASSYYWFYLGRNIWT